MKRKLLKILSIMTSIFFSLAIYDVTFTYADSNTIYFGDINGDSCINAVDASAVLAYYAQISTDHEGGFDKSQQLAADINCDGSINAVDASSVLAYYAAISTNKDGGYSDAQKTAADVDRNGRIDAVDASGILSYYAYASTEKEEVISMEEFMKSIR